MPNRHGDLTEHDHQVMLFNYLALRGVRAFAIPNAAKRSVQAANYMRQEGMQKGVPDVFVAEPMHGYPGLFIEMKKPRTGRLSDEQREWLHALEENGYACAVCYGFNEAQECVDSYMRGDFDARG